MAQSLTFAKPKTVISSAWTRDVSEYPNQQFHWSEPLDATSHGERTSHKSAWNCTAVSQRAGSTHTWYRFCQTARAVAKMAAAPIAGGERPEQCVRAEVFLWARVTQTDCAPGQVVSFRPPTLANDRRYYLVRRQCSFGLRPCS